MKPLNTAERNNAFWRFLLFFLITIALVVMVIFFSIEVPVKEIERLQQKMTDLEKEKEVSKSFYAIMKVATDGLNELDAKSGSRSSVLAASEKVQIEIDRMDKMLKDVPDRKNSIYPLIVQNITELNKAKKELHLSGDK